MITLKTLPEATEQEVFNQVARHLMIQGEKSLLDSGITCVYRGTKGLKCAAGCLIGEDEYHPSMERKKWSQLVAEDIVPKAHQELISELQDVHDCNPPSAWIYGIKNVAKRDGLTFEV